MIDPRTFGRRNFLHHVGFGAALLSTSGLFAEQLAMTPSQTEGPFYPDHLPLDTDNDLLVINDTTTPALGTIAYVTGRVLDAQGKPIRNAVVEIWQADNNGAYLHTGTSNAEKRDTHFQGFGRFLTGSTGEYLFRTIRPVPYPGRAPHIHFAVNRHGKRILTTQLYVKDDPLNERDGIYRSLGNPATQASVTSEFAKLEGGKLGELSAKLDLVLGLTPDEDA